MSPLSKLWLTFFGSRLRQGARKRRPATEADSQALEKAEAKRERKAAKRLRDSK